MWNFVSPRIVFGEDSLSSLSDLGSKKALIVTDQNLVEIGLVEPVQALLQGGGTEVRIFDQVEPDPTTRRAVIDLNVLDFNRY